jgi:hypothetical protein
MCIIKSITVTVLGLSIGLAIATVHAGGAKPPLEPPLDAIPQPNARPNPDQRMAYFLVCAKACDDCARSCNLCSAHCATMLSEGKKEHLLTLRTCQDCATICSAAADVMARNGPFSDVMCVACAEACKRCGDACEKLGTDPIMKQCADECRKCEEACRKMVKATVKKGETPRPEK